MGFSECLRLDLAEHGIGVSVLCPGGVKTQLFQGHARPDELEGKGFSRDDLVRLAQAQQSPPDEMDRPRAGRPAA